MEILQNNNQIEIFNFETKTIRVIGTHEEPYFIVKDICDVLELSNPTVAIKSIPDKWKRSKKSLDLFSGQDMLTVSEPGLYKLIMRSNKPVAEKFQEWICEDVLPSIRKKSEYLVEEYKNKSEEQQKTIELQQKILSKVIKKKKEKYDKGNCFYTAIHPLINGWFKGGLTGDSTDRISKLSTSSPENLIYHKRWYVKDFNILLFETFVFETFKQYRKTPDNEWFSADCLEKMCEFVDEQIKLLEKYTAPVETIPEEILIENQKLFEKENELRLIEVAERKRLRSLERKKIRDEKLAVKKQEKTCEKEKKALERKKIREERMLENKKKIEAEFKAFELKKEEARKALELKKEEALEIKKEASTESLDSDKSFCIKCEKNLPTSRFYTYSATGKLRGTCKTCSNEQNREHIKKVRENLASGKNKCKKCNNVYPYFRLFYKKLDGTDFEECIECYNKENGANLAQCNTCLEIKDKELFQKEKEGFRHRCKACHNKKSRVAYVAQLQTAIRA